MKTRNLSYITAFILAVLVYTAGFYTTNASSEKNAGCSYTIVLTVAPNSTGSWCKQGSPGSQLYQADGNGIATFTNVCEGTYYFCDESGTVYSVVVDGTALTYYPVATSLRCPC